MIHHAPVRATVLIAGGLLLVAALLTILDMLVVFVYIPVPPWIIGVFMVLPLLPLLRGRLVWVRVGLLVVLLGWCLVLPFVPWNNLKAFYIDAGRLETGMTLEEARAVMEPYLEVGPEYLASDLQGGVANESAAERRTRLLFIPSEQNAADWVIIYPDGDRVGRVAVWPD